MLMARGVHGRQSVAVVLVIVIAVTAEQRVHGRGFGACSRDSRAVLCVYRLSGSDFKDEKGGIDA